MSIFEPKQIVLVFECRNSRHQCIVPHGKGQSKLNHQRWEKRSIRSLVVIEQPSKPGEAQVYAVPTAAESHYECYLSDVLHSICGTDVKILYHQRVKEERYVNVRSAHSMVMNDLDLLARIKQLFNISLTFAN